MEGSSSTNTQTASWKELGRAWMVKTPAEPSDSNENTEPEWQNQDVERSLWAQPGERDCSPWQWGNLEKPPGWAGQDRRLWGVTEEEDNMVPFIWELTCFTQHSAFTPTCFLLSGLISHKLELRDQAFLPRTSSLCCLPAAARCRMFWGYSALGGHTSASKEGPGERW